MFRCARPPRPGEALMRRFVRRSLATVSVLTLLIGACSGDESVHRSTVISGLRSADGLLDATLSMEQDWGSGYRARITLTSTSSTPTTGWSVVVALNGSQLTGADISTVSPAPPTTGPVTFRNADWNGRVSSTQSQALVRPEAAARAAAVVRPARATPATPVARATPATPLALVPATLAAAAPAVPRVAARFRASNGTT
jgi:hypothetical protein